MTKMLQSWRWYGPNDPVSLQDIRQAGATDIVTSLHHIPYGEIWPIEGIKKRQKQIELAGLVWTVVESVQVHDDIKRRSGNCDEYMENYKQTIVNLAECGLEIICYNFMPVIDWTRTDLSYELSDGSTALKFDMTEVAVFDIHLLKRKNAQNDYSDDLVRQANTVFAAMTDDQKSRLISNIIAGLPGTDEGYSLNQFAEHIRKYDDINADALRSNLIQFISEIIPVANQVGMRMCIHPDDPPFQIFGLPRILSTQQDVRDIFNAVPSRYNGLTYCTGSFGARPDNDLVNMFKEFADQIHFIHLRSTERSADGSFFEANHLEGDVDIYGVMKAIVEEHQRRSKNNYPDSAIPVRPDHGHLMLDDLRKKTNPGYSGIGRLRGLAELRGLELGIMKSVKR